MSESKTNRPKLTDAELSSFSQRMKVSDEKIKIQFTMEDLVKRLGPGIGNPVASCGGCNGCSGCSM